MTKSFTLIILPDLLTVCRLPPDALIPAWAQEDGGLLSVVRTPEELSIVCPEKLVPANITAERGWRPLKVKGPLVFSEVGVLASLVEPLAAAGISIFVISTFETDYVLVKEQVLDHAVQTLQQAGHTVLTTNHI